MSDDGPPYKCAGNYCPSYPYRASDIRHPASCAYRPPAPSIEALKDAARRSAKTMPRPTLAFWREAVRALVHPTLDIPHEQMKAEAELRAELVEAALGQYASDEAQEAARARWAEILGVEPGTP